MMIMCQSNAFIITRFFSDHLESFDVSTNDKVYTLTASSCDPSYNG